MTSKGFGGAVEFGFQFLLCQAGKVLIVSPVVGLIVAMAMNKARGLDKGVNAYAELNLLLESASCGISNNAKRDCSWKWFGKA